MGIDCAYGFRENCWETKEFFEGMYKRSDVIFSAIHGDTTENMLHRWQWLPYEWRKNCGPLNDPFPCRTPTIVVIQAGAADLDAGRTPHQIAAGVRALMIALHSRFRDHSLVRHPTHYIITGVLPRAPDVLNATLEVFGTHTWGGKLVLPSNFTTISFRDSKYYSEIKKLNAWLKLIAMEASTWQESKLPNAEAVVSDTTYLVQAPPIYPVVYKDCSPLFLENSDGISFDLMPDMRHLSAEGNKAWMQCIYQVVSRLWIDVSKFGGKLNHKTSNRLDKFVVFFFFFFL